MTSISRGGENSFFKSFSLVGETVRYASIPLQRLRFARVNVGILYCQLTQNYELVLFHNCAISQAFEIPDKWP